MSGIEILSAVHGIAPRSDELLRLGADFERGRVSYEAFEERLQQESEEWLQVQQAAGIDLRENGKLRWQDHLRPIVYVSDGFAPDIDDAPVTRWFEDNRFYRQPTIIGRLGVDYDKFKNNFPETGEHISLLSPRSFAYLCGDEFGEIPDIQNVQLLYSDLLFCLEQYRGIKRVTFEEYLPKVLQRNGLNEIQTLADWCRGIQFGAITPNAQGTVPYSQKRNLGIGIEGTGATEIAATDEYRRPEFGQSEIWHQVVNASTTAKESFSPESYVLKTLVGLKPARIVLTHTVDLECLPLVYAQDKIKRLGEFTLELKEHIKEKS